MAPHKLASASMRYKNKPTARIAPFRDDTSLVALRYEQTVQAKPPIPVIPVPPRNPARTIRPVSVASGTTVVVAPPPISPNEQHPALRSRGGGATAKPSSAAAADDGKRDSVLAPATPTSTIHEECEGDAAAVGKFSAREPPASALGDAISFITRASHETAASGLARAFSGEIPVHELFESPRAAPTPASPCTPAGSSPPTEHPPVSLTRAASRRMVRAFSLRPGPAQPSKRLRKKSLSKDADQVEVTPPPSAASSAGAGAASLPPHSRGSSSTSQKWQLSGLGGGANQEDPCPLSLSPSPSHSHAQSDVAEFLPITTNIPTDSLLGEDFLTQLTFSHRGSVMFGGKRAVGSTHPRAQITTAVATEPVAAATAPTTAISAADAAAAVAPPSSPAATLDATPSTPSSSRACPAADSSSQSLPPAPAPKMPDLPNIRILAVDMERESQKVRSLYGPDEEEGGSADGRAGSSSGDRLEPTAEVPSDEEVNAASPSPASGSPFPNHSRTDTPRPTSSSSQRRDKLAKSEFELAGGIEDWQDVDGADVDRFGFISSNPRRTASRAGDGAEHTPQKPTPRKRNVLVKRMDPAVYGSSLSPGRGPSRKVSARSLNTQASEFSTASRRSTRSSIRAAANLLPHNRDRRLMDEAGDMLTLAPGLSDIAEDEQVEKISESFKKKEWERTEKWRKMAKVSHKGPSGQGMEFHFDPKNAKVIDRTWKGIPDCWRAAAWYSFLAASAKQHGSTTTDEELTAEFQRLQSVSSADDTQIDLDVPRTINRHIMFRRRYRGGQRLLFRVLHALSLYFPDTGYVQGMASLAATLLCYYDEEKAFVMLVRMWKYRGLERLYEPGFGSLMTALKDFERDWLRDKEVARKLTELCIDPTAYATRWYLTIFNLSIPFPAQLRVWDVFMLLGEPSQTASATSAPDKAPPVNQDVLHATASALMHALGEVLLDSDFENAMKALTSWIPIKDEELLMQVTRAEWKYRQGKKKKV